MSKAFTTGQAARMCGVSIRTLKRWLERGEMTGYRLPGSGEWRIPRQELVSFMVRHGIPLGELASTPERRILVAGEETEVVNVLALDGRLEVEQAATGYEACLKAGELHPDVVIIDLATLGADGLELARTLRNNHTTRQAKILFITASLSPETASQMEALGHASLPKPIRMESLLSTFYRLAGLARPGPKVRPTRV